VTFVTGHECEGPDGSVDWELLAQLGGTIAVFMGMRSLRAMTRRLLAAGRSAAEPVAIVMAATLPEERVVVGTLATIADQAAATAVASPAIILIGPVVNLCPFSLIREKNSEKQERI